MGRQIKGLLYFYFADTRHSLTVFWTILLSILVVTLTITLFLNKIEDVFLTLSLTGPMYIYCGILGFLTVKEFIPFSDRKWAEIWDERSKGYFIFILQILAIHSQFFGQYY